MVWSAKWYLGMFLFNIKARRQCSPKYLGSPVKNNSRTEELGRYLMIVFSAAIPAQNSCCISSFQLLLYIVWTYTDICRLGSNWCRVIGNNEQCAECWDKFWKQTLLKQTLLFVRLISQFTSAGLTFFISPVWLYLNGSTWLWCCAHRMCAHPVPPHLGSAQSMWSYTSVPGAGLVAKLWFENKTADTFSLK